MSSAESMSDVGRDDADLAVRDSRWTGVAIAAPLAPTFLLFAILPLLSGIYSTYFGLSLTTLGGVLFAAGLFDAVSDPTIGYLSDKHAARHGSRKPFVTWGMLILAPSAWLLAAPVTDAEGNAHLLYFIVFYFAFYLAYTLIRIPQYVLPGVMTANAEQRVRVYGYSKLSQLIGQITFYVIPFLPLFASSRMSPETLKVCAIVGGVLMVPAFWLYQRRVPDREINGGAHVQLNLIRVLRRAFSNRPYLVYLAADIVFNICVGFYLGLQFIFIDSYLGLGAYYSALFLFLLVLGVVMVSPSIWLTNRIGKRRAWALASALFTLCPILVGAMLLFDLTHVALPVLAVCYLLHGLATSLKYVSMNPYLVDVIEYQRLRQDADTSGVYFSLRSFAEKIGAATIGPSVAVTIVGLYGYDPAAPVRTDEVAFGFQVAMCWIPAAAGCLAIALILAMPLTERRTGIIRRRLKARDARLRRAAAAVDSTGKDTA